jgi:carboxypeptidase Q
MLRRPTAALLLLFVAVPAWAQAPPSDDKARAELDRRIVGDARNGSQIITNLTYLSDIIGPRLTGSANLKRATAWGAARMKDVGLVNVRLEPWTIPEGWERGHARARLIDPDNGRTLSIASMGWSPGTGGKVQGDVVVLKADTIQDLDRYKGKLKGAIVLASAPVKLNRWEDATKPGPPTTSTAAKDRPKKSYEEIREFQRARADFLVGEGAVAVLIDASKHFGLLFTTGSWQSKDRPSATNRIPTAAVAHNHYEMLWRLASRPAPARTRVELDIANKFIPGPIIVNNVIGEIKGSARPDEIVVVGAHLDSWDLGQGTTDNGTGTCIVLEAARLLARCGTPPRRTIRFCLFTGEEQGLHGSQAYTKRHESELAKTSVCIVHDAGTGKVTGLGSGARPALKTMLESELSSLKALGLTDFTVPSGGGSDHVSFEKAGVPGFALKQDVATYRFTHHSQADTLDRAQEPDLIQGAQVMAVTAMRIAHLDALLSREKK